jgi:hypothetical protein
MKGLTEFLVENNKAKKVNERAREQIDTFEKEIKLKLKFEWYIDYIEITNSDGDSYDCYSFKKINDTFEKHIGESYEGCQFTGTLRYSLYEGSERICSEYVVEFDYDFSNLGREKCEIEIKESGYGKTFDEELKSQAKKVISDILQIYPKDIHVKFS